MSIKNEHLTKDVGLIPYGMYQFAGYDAFMATYENGDYPNLKYTPGLRLEFIPKISGDWIQDSCSWLKDNAHRIDVLNLYHLCPRSYSHIRTYKRANKNGKVYLKLDGAPLPRRFKLWKNIKSYAQLFRSRLVSTEFQDNAELLTRRWHRRIVCVPNPINPNELSDFRPFSERSSTILTVGRLGTKQKATEILLEAFARIAHSLPTWTLKLAGRIEENMNIADDFYSAH
ncbi:MAG: hypothetical protein IJS39_12815, partial [Synergistaceae bacterium]|nr:hypothetical protein [Synergistaceae bacterium]